MAGRVKCALIIVDIQNDFLPGGSLAVSNGREIIPPVIDLLDRAKWEWDLIIASQDYHPPGHISFASSHPPRLPYETVTLTDHYGREYLQTLWPDHCVHDSRGAELDSVVAKGLEPWTERLKLVRKGCYRCVEGYSLFDGYVTSPIAPEAPPLQPPKEIVTPQTSDITRYLRSESIEKVVVVGLTSEFCVGASAQDAIAAGFHTLLPAATTRGHTLADNDKSLAALESRGAKILSDEEGWNEHLRSWLGW